VGRKRYGIGKDIGELLFQVSGVLMFYVELKERTCDTRSFGVSTTPYVSFQY